MTYPSLLALAPLLILATTVVVAMLLVAVKRRHRLTAAATLVGLALALGSLLLLRSSFPAPQAATPLLIIDAFARFYMGIILVAALGTAALAYTYLGSSEGQHEELYLLLLLATLGGLVLTASRHFAAFFLGLELLSMPMYGMAAYLVKERHSLEAGLKYLVLSAVASAFILFGMALVYSQSATMVFSEIGASAVNTGAARTLLILGVGLILIGIAFKVSLAPFHLWTPDVYQGAPAPVVAFLATASKVAVFALLLRYFVQARVSEYGALVDVLTVLAVLSIAIGNVVALRQNNLKRLLAYSAIAHFGYVLVALVASGPLATEAVGVYLLTYSITSLAAFGVITLVSSPHTTHEAEEVADYRGLFWTRPGLAFILTLALLSLAGVPLTAGFLGKFYVLGAGVDRRQWLLVAAIVIGSAIGLYYYLRAMIQLYLPAEPGVAPSREIAWPRGSGAGALAVLLLLMLALGIYPTPFLKLARAAEVEATPASTAPARAAGLSRLASLHGAAAREILTRSRTQNSHTVTPN